MPEIETSTAPERVEDAEGLEPREAAEYWAFFPIEKVAGVARVGAMSAVIVGALLAAPASAAPSRCKGLGEQACRADTGCAWMPERRAGETKAKSGAPHKTSARAHCRLNTRKTG